MDLEKDNEWLDKAARERQYEELKRNVQDMENRDVRVNLRLVGVKEMAENGKPRDLVRAIIFGIGPHYRTRASDRDLLLCAFKTFWERRGFWRPQDNILMVEAGFRGMAAKSPSSLILPEMWWRRGKDLLRSEGSFMRWMLDSHWHTLPFSISHGTHRKIYSRIPAKRWSLLTVKDSSSSSSETALQWTHA